VYAGGPVPSSVATALQDALLVCRSKHGNDAMTALQGAAQNQLRQYIEQLERLEEEKKAIADDIRDKFAEAKAVGFDVKVMRQILRLRKKSQDDRDEEDAILSTYLHALGMIEGFDDGSATGVAQPDNVHPMAAE
jgi:uncharacterized protein (UPF0335 family)